MEALRTCQHCGLEAFTRDDLEEFTFGRDRKYNRKNECKKCGYNQKRNHQIRADYGVTREEYDLLMSEHESCNICGKEVDMLHYDHEHGMFGIEAFRGALCPKCNKGLGLFKDNIRSLRMAIQYLEKFQGGAS